MSETKKESSATTSSNEISVKDHLKAQRADVSWKKEPWINKEDGFQYRRQRVENPDGTFQAIDVKIGTKPMVEPQKKG